MTSIAEKTDPTKPILLLVESTEIAAQVRPLLGVDYVVRSTEGQLAPISRGFDAIDIDNDFATRTDFRIFGHIAVAAIKTAMIGTRAVVLAMSPGGEGELIAAQVVQFVNPTLPVSRITFSEVTHDALMEALANPREIDMNLAEAGRVREVIDRLYTAKVAPKGRLTLLAMRLVVERDLARMAAGPTGVKPERYRKVTLVEALGELGVGSSPASAMAVEECKKEYVWQRDGDEALMPTLTAFAVWRLMMEHFRELVDFDIARSVETLIDEVAADASRRSEVLRAIYFGSDDDAVGIGRVGVKELQERLAKPIHPDSLYVWELGKHPATGETVVLRPALGTGRGSAPYIQCGNHAVSVSDHTALEEWSLSRACELLSLAQ